MLVWALTGAVLAGPLWLGPPRPADAPPPQRIVSLAPSVTEFICALDACDRLVGVTRFDDFPVTVRQLPKVGGFADLSVEAVVALHPDVVIAMATGSGRAALETLARLGISVLVMPCESLDDVWQAFPLLGTLLHHEAAATREAARLHAALRPTPDAGGPRVLLVVGHKPLVVVGNGGFLTTLITLAGGRNAVQTGPAYPTLDLEALMQLDPDVVVDVSGAREDRDFWTKIPSLRAMRQHRVTVLEDPTLVRPGPRLDAGLRRLRAALELH